jgi:hypothetical protein
VTIRLLRFATLALVMDNATAATAQPKFFVESGILQSRDEFATERLPGRGRRHRRRRRAVASVQCAFRMAVRRGFRLGKSSRLVAVHSREYWRVALAVLGGATVADAQSTQSGIREQRAPANLVIERRAFEDHSSKRSLVPTAGLDVPVGITERLSIVPELRLYLASFPVGTIVRTGVTGRWRF